MDLYEAVETICKDYCKYPDIESGNRLADICDKCPMNKCEDLRWADRKDKPQSIKTIILCGVGDTFPWIHETPPWCPIDNDEQSGKE